jgi:hypothetical protein
MVIRFKKKTEETVAQDSAVIPAPVMPVILQPKVETAIKSISANFAKKKKLLDASASAMSLSAAVAAAGIVGGAAAASMASIMTMGGAAGVISSVLVHKFNPRAKTQDKSVFPFQMPPSWTMENADEAAAAVNDGLRGSITVKGPLQYKQRGTMWMVA